MRTKLILMGMAILALIVVGTSAHEQEASEFVRTHSCALVRHDAPRKQYSLPAKREVSYPAYDVFRCEGVENEVYVEIEGAK